MTTYARRCLVAERIQAQYPYVTVEAVHPDGPIGIAYLVNRIGYATARDAREAAARANAAEATS